MSKSIRIGLMQAGSRLVGSLKGKGPVQVGCATQADVSCQLRSLAMRHVAFGTAQLFGRADASRSEDLLLEAWRCGVRRFDTAPSYGEGLSEPGLGRFLAGREGIEAVTTKVGLVPRKGPVQARALVAGIARRVLPPSVMQQLRSRAHAATTGHFGVDEVRASVEESLSRLNGRVDRLLLHEVMPGDITDELLQLLESYRQRGDVGALGVATRNEATAAALARAGDLFTVVHLAIGPMDQQVSLPSHVSTRVGHGLFGGRGGQLRALQAVLDRHSELSDEWSAATADTQWAGEGGLARALLSRVSTVDVTEVIVGTTRTENLRHAYHLATRAEGLPSAVVHVLARLTDEATLARTS